MEQKTEIMFWTSTQKRIKFRQMKKADAGQAAAIEAMSSGEAWTADGYLDALKNPNALYIVAEMDETVIGCCGLWQSFEDADVCNVVIAPEFRRQGIARQMLLALFEMGKKVGIENFTLEVRKGNVPAIKLYEELGFVTEGIRKNFYDKPKEDALIMWKR